MNNRPKSPVRSAQEAPFFSGILPFKRLFSVVARPRAFSFTARSHSPFPGRGNPLATHRASFRATPLRRTGAVVFACNMHARESAPRRRSVGDEIVHAHGPCALVQVSVLARTQGGLVKQARGAGVVLRAVRKLFYRWIRERGS